MKLSLLWLPFLLICGCEASTARSVQKSELYDLENPDSTWVMPSVLNEISGISAISDRLMGCINDEKGEIYFYNLDRNKIDTSISFTGKGDYEDIVIIDSMAYVLESKGVIWQVDMTKRPAETTKYKTSMHKSLDAEGLAYDAQSNDLLIAAKNKIKDKTGLKVNVIYKFDLTTQKGSNEPFITWHLNDFVKKDDFASSALAIHPASGNIYITSSVGKKLVVINRLGQVLEMVTLDYKHFSQPEGIYFDANSNLFISNERKKSKANILKFNINNSKLE